MDENNNSQGLTGIGHNYDSSLGGLGNDEISVQKWLRARFQEKEDLLRQFYNIHNQCPPPTTTIATNTVPTPTHNTTNSKTSTKVPVATPIHSSCSSSSSSDSAYANNNNTNTTNNVTNKDHCNTTSNSNSNTTIPWPKLLTTNSTIDTYAIIIMCT